MNERAETPSAIDAMVDENMNLRAEIDEKDDLLDTTARRADAAEDELERSKRRVGFAGEAPADAATDFEVPDDVDSSEDAGDDVSGDDSAELAAITAERDAYLADSQRLAADFANFRKQSEKRIADTASSQSAALVRDLISVLDACDSALTQDPDSAVAPIRSALLGELQRNGLEIVSPEPETAFDPEMHEAVMHEINDDPSDDEGEATQRVAELFRAGYAWKGRVVRPAMVKVVG